MRKIKKHIKSTRKRKDAMPYITKMTDWSDFISEPQWEMMIDANDVAECIYTP